MNGLSDLSIDRGPGHRQQKAAIWVLTLKSRYLSRAMVASLQAEEKPDQTKEKKKEVTGKG